MKSLSRLKQDVCECRAEMAGLSRVCEAEVTLLIEGGSASQLAVAGRGGPVSRLSSTGPRTDAH